MKRKKSSIIFLFVSLFVLSCFALSYNAKATSDINYTFIDNVLYESDDIELSDSFNLQNESIATELYNATYSFEDDEIGEFPLEWVSYGETTTNEAFVSSDYKEHNKVLTLENDTDIGLEQVIYPSNLTSNVVEFWVLKESGLSGVVIEFYNDIAINLTFMMVIDYNNNGLIREYEGSDVWETITDKYADDVWIHIKISFNDASHLLDVYVNGVLEMEDNPYVENVDIGLIRVRFGWGTMMSKCRFDAFGYSWEPIYDFTDDIIGEVPDEWIDLNDVGYIINEKEGRSKVYSIVDSSNEAKITNDFNFEIESGIIEFWLYINQTNKRFSLFLSRSTAIQIYLDWGNDGELKNNNTDFLYNYLDNVWEYYKIIFNCTSNTYDLWINEIEINTDICFYGDVGIIDRFEFHFREINTFLYFDGISYSWEYGYNVGDNIFPIFNTTSNLVVAKDEFAYDSNGEIYDLGIKDACEWEGNDIDYTYLIQDTEQSYDRNYKIHCEGTTANKFIRKYYNNIDDGVYNFTLKINYLWMFNVGSSYWWAIYSTLLNITVVIELIVIAPAQIALRYLDDIDAETYTFIGYIDVMESDIRELTLFIGDLCYLTYKDAVKYYEVIFPKLAPEEEGLYEVSFAGGLDDTDDIQIIHIDSIGVFVNGTAVNNDFASSSLDLDSATWYSKRNNIININALGIFSLGVSSETDSTSLKGLYNYTNSKTWNVYNYFPYITDPSLIFITNTTISVLNVKITGVKMTDETSTFIPHFYYGSVNIDESYFYVDSSNRLQFNLIADDNNTEWIELRFDILFKTTENRSIQFKSNIDGISRGYVHLAYWGFVYTDIYFPTYLKTTTLYLPQGYVIFTMSIIISDEDITWYDDCSGYITNLKLLHTPGGLPITLLPEIDITVLIAILIPLIIILAPTFAIFIKFGKNGLMLMFVLMSLICAITGLIPIWLFFIIVVGIGTFLFVDYKKGGI